MLVMMEAIQNRIVENGKRGKATWLYIDEFHVLLLSLIHILIWIHYVSHAVNREVNMRIAIYIMSIIQINNKKMSVALLDVYKRQE